MPPGEDNIYKETTGQQQSTLFSIRNCVYEGKDPIKYCFLQKNKSNKINTMSVLQNMFVRIGNFWEAKTKFFVKKIKTWYYEKFSELPFIFMILFL